MYKNNYVYTLIQLCLYRSNSVYTDIKLLYTKLIPYTQKSNNVYTEIIPYIQKYLCKNRKIVFLYIYRNNYVYTLIEFCVYVNRILYIRKLNFVYR